MLGVGSRFKRSAGARRTHQVLRLGCFGAAAVVLAVFSLLSASDDGSHGGVLSGGGASSTARRRLTEGGSLYPDDAFGKEGMKKGAIMLHIIGVMYTFAGIAIVCDDFFVPALEVLVEKYKIQDDVAGATFMAAGGSAPELFTALIGVFIAKSNVGFGTIIGSAVFNVLFVIGACAFFSKEILVLTWWPLFRDCCWYTFDLLMLYVFFRDEHIDMYESGLLLVFYLCYVLFMSQNSRAETFFKKTILRQKDFVATTRHDEERAEKKAQAISPAAPSKLSQVSPGPGAVTESALARTMTPKALERSSTPRALIRKESKRIIKSDSSSKNPGGGDDDDDDGGIDLDWPDELSGKIYFVLLCPIMFGLAYTIPNCKKKEHLWPVVFIESILYIGFFSYFMVWWATSIGAVVGISDEVMGYTFLAAGTSVPDLMSSVIVARQGFGDMAVSSSIGSNIFDITLGLPLPWFLWSIIEGGKGIDVISNSLNFSLLLLILMLVSVVIIIAVCGWRMTKGLGFSMVVLYGLFLTLAVLNSRGVIGGID